MENNYNKLEMYNIISHKDYVSFENIENHKLLGASNHIEVIGNMIENIVNENDNIDEILYKIKYVSNYYINTRGKASSAIINAIQIMTKNIYDLDIKDINLHKSKILYIKNSYTSQNESAILNCIKNSYTILKDKRNIMLFDYSSTVEKSIINLSKTSVAYNIYIPESRIIDGGIPYLFKLSDFGFNINFFPDSAIFYFLKKCEIVLMGAETFYPDGTAFNTTGSDMIAVLCKEMNIPLYFITPMIKVDSRMLKDVVSEKVLLNLKSKLIQNESDTFNVEKIKFTCPELLPISPKYIKGFITEFGTFDSKEIFSISEKYIKEIGG